MAITWSEPRRATTAAVQNREREQTNVLRRIEDLDVSNTIRGPRTLRTHLVGGVGFVAWARLRPQGEWSLPYVPA